MDGEEWVDGDDGHPRLLPWAALIALLGACLPLVAAAIAVPHLLPRPSLTILTGGGAALGLAAWLVALPLGLRSAGLAVRIGALLLLAAGGAVAGLSADRTYVATGRQDASSFAEAEIAPNGAISLPSGAVGRGPLSNLYADQVAEAGIDRKNENDAVAKINFQSLYSAYLLEQDPSPLTRCASVSVLKASAARTAARDKAREAKLAAAIDGAGLPDALRNGILMMTVHQNLDAILAQQQATLDILEAECRLLARRTWRNRDDYFVFGNADDLKQFAAIRLRGRAATEALAKLTAAETDRMRQGREFCETR